MVLFGHSKARCYVCGRILVIFSEDGGFPRHAIAWFNPFPCTGTTLPIRPEDWVEDVLE